MKYTTYDFIIDPELRDHLESVQPTVDSELEMQLIATNGPRDPIVVWKGKRVIVDGMRRYAICQKLNLPYEIVEIDFKTIQDVKDWMDSFQGCRRNMSPAAFAQLLTRRVRAIESRKREAGATHSVMGTYKEVASEFDVSDRTVMRATEVSDALEKLPADLKELVTSRKVKIRNSDLIEIAEYSELHQRHIFNQVATGEFDSITSVLKGVGEENDEEEDDIPFDTSPRDTTEDEDEEDPPSVEEIEAEAGGTPIDRPAPTFDTESNATGSPSERTPRRTMPSSLPLTQTLLDTQKALGKVAKFLDELKKTNRDRYKIMRSHLVGIGKELKDWLAENG